MPLWLQIVTLIVGGFHAAASFFYFSRGRFGAVWAAAWTALTLTAILHAHSPAPLVFWSAIAAWHLWWASLRPRADRDWSPELARQTTGEIVAGRLVLHDVRNFEWRREEDDYTVRWETRSYDLAALESIDLFSSYWTVDSIAHHIVSFGFAGQGQLAFSIEVRRQRDRPWSSLAGFFKAFELITLAVDERDVVRLRTRVRREDVRLYRLRTTPEFRLRLLAAYVADCNRLASEPRFFHTFFTNCTTQIVRLVRAAGGAWPLDWRMIASGFLPNYLHRIGILDDSLPFADLRAAAAISGRARDVDADPDFSLKIREGIPKPD